MWLLEPVTKKIMEDAQARAATLTAADFELYTKRASEPGDGSRISQKGIINIDGVLTNTPDIFAMLFGGGNTSYPEIISAIAAAEADPAVENITLRINSPGGNFVGLYSAMEAIQATSKPITAEVLGMAASAAYGLAAQTDKITATDKGAQIGSIGVAATLRVDPEMVILASTNAPKKRPDPSTPEGKAIITEGLDNIHNLFVDSIAAGRGVSAGVINATFGEGATLLAEDALARGMIDAVTSAQTPNGITKEEVKMELTLIQLQTEHVALYNEIVATAKAEGVETERSRVEGHIRLADDSGDLVTAINAIKNGDGITAEVTAAHVQASAKALAIANREADDVATAAASQTETGGEATAASLEDQLMDALELKRGIGSVA